MYIRALVPVALALAGAACDDLGLNAEPQQLAVEVETVGAERIMLVTSTNWVYSEDPACDPAGPGCPQVLRVLQADTTTVPAPYRQTLRFTNDYRYLIEVAPAGGVTATVRMRVDIDGRRWFDEARQLSPAGADGEQETLQFVYQWRRPTIR